MCGILAALGLTGTALENRRKVAAASLKMRHRGPDDSCLWQNSKGDCFLAFERLQIVDPSDTGRQPFVLDTPDGTIAWALNSEIYNHRYIRDNYLSGVDIRSHSDSVCPGYLYQKLGDTNEIWNLLDGIFACVIYDGRTGEFIAARDPIGICSLYWGRGKDGSMWFASELKAIQDECETFEFFPPGHVYRSSTGKLERWFKPNWLNLEHIPAEPADLPLLKTAFIDSVVKRLMSDVPLGILLSGGLDSSLVASVAVRHLKEAKNAFDREHKVHTFSIGVPGSPDLAAARRVADQLGTEHHEFTFTVQEGLDALPNLIYHIESYEQVRAAVPMYLLSRRIKALGIKVVLSGEGADEAFGGYLYFHKAPSPAEFQQETVRLVKRLHQWDVLRANKAPFAFGLETRVPFLDKEFLQLAMNINPREKMINMAEKPDGKHARMEKYILRKAFDCPEDPYLPESVLWRQKEQFSDGVGYDWVDGIKSYAEQMVSDEQFAQRAQRYPDATPRNKEYYLLRQLFEEQFPSKSALDSVPQGLSIACSTPEALKWDPAWEGSHEISGRAMQGVHEAGDSFKLSGSSASLNGLA